MRKIYFNRMDFRYEDGQVIGSHLGNALIEFIVDIEGEVADGYEQDSDFDGGPYIYKEDDNSSNDEDDAREYQIGDILLLNPDSDAPEGCVQGNLTLGTVVGDSSEGTTSLVVTPTFEHTWKGWDDGTAKNSWYISLDQVVRKVGTQCSMRCI